MNAKDMEMLTEIFTASLPECENIKKSIDDVTQKVSYVGTNDKGQRIRFVIDIKVIQVSSAPKEVKE